MKPVCRIGGVPEHYNAPWLTALQSFEDPEYDFAWENYPQGTGAMLEDLSQGKLDVALVLTEGAVARAVNKKDASIMGTFVSNSLPWGVHVSPNNAAEKIADLVSLESLVFGISRFGSGSHLMAKIMDESVTNFKVVDTMAGAAEAMKRGEIDVFLWDVATADAFAREGVWKCIGTVSGEWPAFVLAVRPNCSLTEPILRVLNQVRNHGMLLKEEPEFATLFLCDKYRITQEQAGAFIESISWSAAPNINRAALERVVSSLRVAQVITEAVDLEKIVSCEFL